jgi:hypothetical protein
MIFFYIIFIFYYYKDNYNKKNEIVNLNKYGIR